MRGKPCYPDRTLGPDRQRASLERGVIAEVQGKAQRFLSKRGVATSLAILPPRALRVRIRELHAEHVAAGGVRTLPDLATLTSHHLRLLALELQRANSGLKGGG